MRVVDTHVHLWRRDVASFGWMDDAGLPDHCLVDEVPSSGQWQRSMVLVEVDSDPSSALDEARWFSSLTQDDAQVAGFVANLPFTLDVREALRVLDELPGWLGIRWLFQDHPERIDEARTDEALQLIAEAGVPFDLCVRHHELEAATALVARHPELTVVLDHCGKPPLTQPDLLDTWAVQVAALAALPNTVVKLSGLTAEAEGLPSSEAEPVYRRVLGHCLDIFGAERAMVGSDWPISPLFGDNAAGWFDLVADVAGAGADQVMHATSSRVYAGSQAGETPLHPPAGENPLHPTSTTQGAAS